MAWDRAVPVLQQLLTQALLFAEAGGFALHWGKDFSCSSMKLLCFLHLGLKAGSVVETGSYREPEGYTRTPYVYFGEMSMVRSQESMMGVPLRRPK